MLKKFFYLLLLFPLSVFGGFTNSKTFSGLDYDNDAKQKYSSGYSFSTKGVLTDDNYRKATYLENGTVYRVSQSYDYDFNNYYKQKINDWYTKEYGYEYISSMTAEDYTPLIVKDNSTVVLYLDKNVTLKLKGRNAGSASAYVRMGGGPAITVPTNSTLIVTGQGTLDVTGGSGQAGRDGGRGCDAYLDERWEDALSEWDECCGEGGLGGDGGGGGAAAIGGGGGKGGYRGDAATTTEVGSSFSWGDFEEDDKVYKIGNQPGGDGSAGGNGGGCGTVYIFGSVTVKTAIGTQQAGGKGGAYSEAYLDVGTVDDYVYGGGGGGGGGGAGTAAPRGIGPGGGGGGGGGGGASGTTVILDYWYLYCPGREHSKWEDCKEWHCDGHGGEGGKGVSPTATGEKGKEDQARTLTKKADDDTRSKHASRDPREGGNGGSAGVTYSPAASEFGSVWRFHSAKLEGATTSAQTIDEERVAEHSTVLSAIAYKLNLFNTADSIQTFDVLLGSPFPRIVHPTRSGYKFRGFFTGRNGAGTMYYDENGEFNKMLNNCYTEFRDITLYASWEYTGKVFTKTVHAGESDVLDGQFDGTRLVQPPQSRMITIERGSTLMLRNLTFLGNDLAEYGMILNEGTLIVSNCVFNGIYSPFGWGAVYQDRPGAKALFYGCTFIDNVAYDSPAIAAEGSTVSLVHCMFYRNRALSSQSGSEKAAAVSSTDGGKLNIISCTFLENTVAEASPSGGSATIIGSWTSDSSPSVNFFNTVNVTPSDNGLWGVSGSLNWSFFSGEGNLERGKACNNTETVLGPRKDIEVDGVTQITFRPLNSARTAGVNGPIYRSPDWEKYSTGYYGPENSIRIEGDQVGQRPIFGWAGAHNGNTLQSYIDDAPEGSTLIVPPGKYYPATLNKKLTVIGENRDQCIINGEGIERCVTFGKEAKTCVWSGFTLTNGYANVGGGFAYSEPYGGIVSNCVFRNCSAEKGGAVAYASLVTECELYRNQATDSGGGTYGCKTVERTVYGNNVAQISGGAAAHNMSEEWIYSSLIGANQALNGGAVRGMCLGNCTLVNNSAVSNNTADASYLWGCLIYPDATFPSSGADRKSTFLIPGSAFASPANNDFHLLNVIVNPTDGTRTHVNQDARRVLNSAWVDETYANHRLDFEGYPLVNVFPGASAEKQENRFLYAGCYSYLPFKANGLMVTGTEDYYDNVPSMTSLREAITEAERFPEYVSSNGEFRITFDPETFGNGNYRELRFNESQIVIDAFTNHPLVVTGPTNGTVVVNGQNRFRAFTVKEKNHLRVENLTFTNCRGGAEGSATTDGGAIQNYGMLEVTNCAFTANSSGSRLSELTTKVGFGGAIATEKKAESRIWHSTFSGNAASKGGAVWNGKDAKTSVFFSTFINNAADVDRKEGGAIASDDEDPKSTLTALALVNCTVTSNRTEVSGHGGGVFAGPGLTLLNSLVVGNFAGAETNDVYLAPPLSGPTITGTFVNTAYGVRNDPTYAYARYRFNDVESRGGCTAAEAFSPDGSRSEVVNGVTQIVLPRYVKVQADGVTNLVLNLAATNVWVARCGADIGYGKAERGPLNIELVSGNVVQLWTKGERLNEDQEGLRFDACILGATVLQAGRVIKKESFSVNNSSVDDGGGEIEEPEVLGKIVLVHGNGTKSGYQTAKDAISAYRTGDSIVVNTINDEDPDVGEIAQFAIKVMLPYAQSHDWFTFTMSEDYKTFTMTLDEEKALPTVEGFSTSDAGLLGGRVSVTPGNLKPDLWYAIGYSTNPIENFTVVSDWVQAKEQPDGSVRLTEALTVPAEGDHAFYIIFTSAGKR